MKRRLYRFSLGFSAMLILMLGTAFATQEYWLPYAMVGSYKSLLSLARHRHVPEYVSRQMRVTVGPPAAELALWILDPTEEPRGTVVVLHGFQGHKRTMLKAGQALARDGYRAVLVDLRGHGESSGDWVTFGVQDARDLSQVLDALERENLLTEPVGAYGTSYGAATALLWAGQDSRVCAVVSVAAFTTMQNEVPCFMRGFNRVPRWFVSDEQVQESIRVAGKLAGFDPAASSPLAAIQRTDAPVLLFHGTSDVKIPVEQARRLYAAADHNRSKLVIVEGAGHDSFFRDADGIISRETIAWLDKWLVTDYSKQRKEQR